MSADEFILDSAVVRDFVAGVRTELARGTSPEVACAAIRPAFAALLADQGWLPDELAAPVPGSGRGGGGPIRTLL